MKIETSREQLMAAVNAFKLLPQKVGESDLTIRIQRGIPPDQLTMLAQAESMAMEISVGASSVDCDSPFAVCARYFNSFVSAMPDGALTINSPSQKMVKLVALGSRSSFAMARIESPTASMPTSASPNHVIKCFAHDLNRALTRVSSASSTDVTRRALVGVHLVYSPESTSDITLVATDGRRINVDRAPTTGDVNNAATAYTIPLALVRVLQRMLQSCARDQIVTIALDGDNAVEFIGADWRLRGAIVDEKFPDWPRVIPTESTVDACIIVDRELMLLQLQCAMLAAVERDEPVTLIPNRDNIAVECKNDANTASQFMPCELKCAGEFKSRAIAVNPFYLKDALSAITTETARININAATSSPILIRAGGSDATAEHCQHWQAVVMPMRRN